MKKSLLLFALGLMAVPMFAADAAREEKLFPKVSRYQVHARLNLPASQFEPDYDTPPPEWNPTGGGGYTSPWSGCKTNMACSVNTIGDCYERSYSRCQSRVGGTGAPCQAC
jgi:hypothetical protein